MSKIRLRDGGSHHDLQITDDKGRVSTYDLSKLSKVELSGVRELVVNFWCRERGLAELYA
jgi:hypothetical protein